MSDPLAAILSELRELKDRIGRLEKLVSNFIRTTTLSEETIVRDAGKPGDEAHRGVIHQETDPQFEQAAHERSAIRDRQGAFEAGARGEHLEIRGEIEQKVGSLRDRLNELIGSVREVQATTIAMLTFGALVGAVLLFILAQIIGL